MKKMIKNFVLAMDFASLILMADVAAMEMEKDMCTSLVKVYNHVQSQIPAPDCKSLNDVVWSSATEADHTHALCDPNGKNGMYLWPANANNSVVPFFWNKYEVINGTIGMNRDINMKLTKKLNDKMIATLMDVSYEYFVWKDHFLFTIFRIPTSSKRADKIVESMLNEGHYHRSLEIFSTIPILRTMKPRDLVIKCSDRENIIEREDISREWVYLVFDNAWNICKKDPVAFSNDVNAIVDSIGNTPLHYVVHSQKFRFSLVPFLTHLVIDCHITALKSNLEGKTACDDAMLLDYLMSSDLLDLFKLCIENNKLSNFLAEASNVISCATSCKNFFPSDLLNLFKWLIERNVLEKEAVLCDSLVKKCLFHSDLLNLLKYFETVDCTA
jgi:hypothetical protein